MKHTFLLSAVTGLLLTACATKPSYKLVGTAPADIPDGSVVYLRNDQRQVLDSALVQNQTFAFTGRQDSVVERWITCKAGNQSFRGVVFLENADLKISYQDGKCLVTGSTTNDIYYQFMAEYDKRNQEIGKVYKQSMDKNLTDEERVKLQEQVHQMNMDCQAMVAKTISDNVLNPVGASLIPNFGYQYPEKQQKEWLLQIPEAKRTEGMKFMLSRIERVEKTSVGQKFTDLAMKTPEGKDVKLSEYVSKNKFTLLDFWASWCGPCRAEMPNVVKAYQKYHQKGFGIISVSLDQDAKRWTKAIEELKMDWDHMSDLKGWDCAGSKLYGVAGIPSTVLIAQDGTILARDLRGDALDKKLEELLK